MDQDLFSKNSTPQSEKKESKKMKKDEREHEGFGMNLIVEERKKEVSQSVLWNNLFQILGSAVLAGAIVGVVYLGIRWYGSTKEQEIQAIRDSVQKVDAEIATLESNYNLLVRFQTKLSSTKNLLENHVSFLKFFDELEKNTLPQVAYQNISFSDDGSVTLTATATDYASVGKQLLAYQKVDSFIKKARINAINGMLSQTGDLAGVNFTIQITIDKEWLKKKTVTAVKENK